MPDDMNRVSGAMERRLRTKSTDEVFQDVVVRSLTDIRRVIKSLDADGTSGKQDTSISTDLEGTDKDDKRSVYKVNANVKDQTRRDILIEGLSISQRQQEVAAKQAALTKGVTVNGIEMRPPSLPKSINHCWVDKLIKRWLGGFRIETMICWDIEGYRYSYNAFDNKLSRVPYNGNAPQGQR